MRKLDGKAVTAGGSVGSSGPLGPVFFALNIDTLTDGRICIKERL